MDPNTYDGKFFQEEGLEGRFEIDLTDAIEMDVDLVDEEAEDEVENLKDLELLQRLHVGDDNITPSDDDDYIDMADSDDETFDPANPDHDDYF